MRKFLAAVFCSALLTMGIGGAGMIHADAKVKNPVTLCEPHDGVAHVGSDFVECVDGEVFDL